MKPSDWTSATVAERHAAMTDRSGGPDACWPWTGFVSAFGYGRIQTGKSGQWKTDGAHRVAFVLANGEADESLVIDHLCFNRCCQNPLHLRQVPRTENARRWSRRPGPAVPLSGERIGTSKLTEAAVADIRSRWRFRKITQASLAREYGVSVTTIQRILYGQLWRHVA